MTTKTDIANLAAQTIGIDQSIADIESDNSKLGVIVRRWYDHCRDEVLESYPWSFATKAVALATSTDDPLPGWSFAYTYPTDCLNALEVTTEAGARNANAYVYDADFYNRTALYFPRVPWRLALSSSAESRLILCDIEAAYLIYVARATSPVVYSRSFITALTMRLAAAISIPMRVDAGIAKAAAEQYQAWEFRARALMNNQGLSDPPVDSPSITVRD